MIGEKFIEKRIEGNKIIRVAEIKDFNYDYNKIVNYINDNITDDPEELYTDYGIIIGFDEVVGIDCDDKCLEKVEELISDAIADEENHDDLDEFLIALQKASGYFFYFGSQEVYKKEVVKK